jgi:hypothetical protein
MKNKILNIKNNENLEIIYSVTLIFFIIFFFSNLFNFIKIASASVTVESLPDNKVFNDFVIGPGKIDMELAPGQTGTFELSISNRLGTNKSFSLSLEDFTGSEDPKQTVVLLGSDRGPYSLRDFIKLGTSTLNIEHGTRARVSVSVSVPKNAEPGGLYGSVLVGILSKGEDKVGTNGVVSTNPIITRIGTLIFIKVKGDVKEDGKLTNFTLAQNSKIISGTDGVTFDLFFRNDGNIHLNPKGNITIKNMLGATVGDVAVEPWFAMPKSVRFREVSWNPNFLFGKYTAIASVERGYGEIKDDMEYTFWAIPWKVILAIFVGVIVVFLVIKKIRRK